MDVDEKRTAKYKNYYFLFMFWFLKSQAILESWQPWWHMFTQNFLDYPPRFVDCFLSVLQTIFWIGLCNNTYQCHLVQINCLYSNLLDVLDYVYIWWDNIFVVCMVHEDINKTKQTNKTSYNCFIWLYSRFQSVHTLKKGLFAHIFPTDIHQRFQAFYTTLCNGFISHEAQFGGCKVFADHACKNKCKSNVLSRSDRDRCSDIFFFDYEKKPEDHQIEPNTGIKMYVTGSGISGVYLWYFPSFYR